ncbi:hypothetical protein HGT73_10590 [Rosenbergiella australiborealis]|uniref:Uncharacterized protein n=1 Tax=Rosenbergiella australiborealis TaxID=1544696 RepID=A0ABS5T657_9GAMM|nr:hypothetical protein [Rosenbergiella australiborealis]MBT0727811.1 hypothetical protein [Rosenbergiella australiborealis]
MTGWINGFIGVLIFSGSLPATKLAIAGFNQDILGRAGREVIDASVLRNKVTALIALIKAEGFAAPSVIQLWRE